MWNNHQVAINDTETVKNKLNFDSKTQTQEVVIQGFHADDGDSNASYFTNDMLNN